MTIRLTSLALIAASSACLIHPQAQAAEDFQVRYNIAGSLGGEMFAAPEQSGTIAGAAVTHVNIHKVTGNDGKGLTVGIAGGTVPAPYAANQASIDARGPFTQINLGLGYITEGTYGGGRIAFGINLPYATKNQQVSASATTPTLSGVPPEVQAAFGAQYQAGVAAQADAMTGKVSGLGDVELQAGWLHASEKVRVLAGGSLVLPTGRYDSSPGPDIGAGNFYTFRPAMQVAYLPRPDVAFAGKVTLGLNTTNRDNKLRSGNWIGLEAAAGYMTAVGPVGVHMIHIQQYQDDNNNALGASRLRMSNAGLFFTTMLPVVDAPVTIQYMSTVSSRNSKSGDFYQVRVVKVF